MHELNFTKHWLSCPNTRYMDTIVVISQNIYSGRLQNIVICEMSLLLLKLHKTMVVKVLTLSREYKMSSKFSVCSDDC